MGTFQWILIYVVFMVVLFLPQILSGRKRKKEQETMLGSLKIGDEIVTIGGIHGKIASVSEATVEIVIDKGEKPEQAAARELAEETGFCANTLIPLASMSPNPALFSNTVHFFAAHDLTYRHAENPDEDEFLRSTAVPLQQINKKIGQPPYVHALMAAALCLYNNRFS